LWHVGVRRTGYFRYTADSCCREKQSCGKGIARLRHCRSEEALRITEELLADANVQPDVAYWMAFTYAKLGMNEEAIRSLEKVAEARWRLITIIGLEPGFASLRSEPRFQALLRKIGLSQ